ncbi:hypothetical protein KEM55_005905 [Ascosphaera atra]|nr:hypothetical protein KEM55_005905 [Ascosphaera atra]
MAKRTTIERTFGVFKQRFKIFRGSSVNNFRTATQVKLVVALASLHNYMNRHGQNPEIWEEEALEDTSDVESDDGGDEGESQPATQEASSQRTDAADRRERMAQEMWIDYCENREETQGPSIY